MLKHLWREHKESITTSGRVSTAQPNTESSAAFFNNFKRKLMHLGALLYFFHGQRRREYALSSKFLSGAITAPSL